MRPVFPKGLSFIRIPLSTSMVEAAVPVASAARKAYQFPRVVVLTSS